MPKHKTSATHNTLQLGVNKKIHSYMKLYVDHVRCKVPNLAQPTDVNGPFFITWTGKPMTQSLVAQQLTPELSSVGFKHRVSCTKFWKMTVTLVGEVLCLKVTSFIVLDYICNRV